MNTLTIPQKFREIANKNLLNKALGKKENGEFKYINYQELLDKVDYFTSAIIELDIKPKDKIAIMSENSPEWTITDIGTLSAGALDVPIYPTLTHIQVEYLLKDCKAKGVIVSNDKHYQKIIKSIENLPDLEFIVYVDEVSKVENTKVKMFNFNEFLEIGKQHLEKNKDEIQKRISETKENDVCSIIYTSGTEGIPKGVMLSHKNFLSNATACADVFNITSEYVELSFLPLSHVLERVVYYALMVVSGATIAYAESMDAITKNLVEVKPSLVASVPRIFEKIYLKVMDDINSSSQTKQRVFQWAIRKGKEYYEATKYKKGLSLLLEIKYKIADKLVFSKIKEKTGGNIKVFVSGGAPLSKEIIKFFAYIGLPVLEGYGLTESSPVIAVSSINNIKFGAVGKVLPGVEVKIADDGEILARGPNIMVGYYNNPDGTAEVIDKDGWLHTGDIGELDSENYLKITDRKKDIIIMSNGKNVAPQNIENILKNSKYIDQVAVMGNNRKYISALIIPNYEHLLEKAKELGIDVDDREKLAKDQKIYDFMRKEIDEVSKDRLAQFEEIKTFTILFKSFTLENNEITPTLKLKRNVIASNYSELIDSMYS